LVINYIEWKNTPFSKLSEAEGIVALREANSLPIQHQRSMKKAGWSIAKCFIKKQLPGGGKEQIGSPDHLGNLHGGIVDGTGELVGREVIVAPEDEIAKIPPRDEFLRAAGKIDKSDSSFRR
jgi:hypothetical protein